MCACYILCILFCSLLNLIFLKVGLLHIILYFENVFDVAMLKLVLIAAIQITVLIKYLEIQNPENSVL